MCVCSARTAHAEKGTHLILNVLSVLWDGRARLWQYTMAPGMIQTPEIKILVQYYGKQELLGTYLSFPSLTAYSSISVMEDFHLERRGDSPCFAHEADLSVSLWQSLSRSGILGTATGFPAFLPD